MADGDDTRCIFSVYDLYNVFRNEGRSIVCRVSRFRGTSITKHVWNYEAVALFGEERYLVSPVERGTWKPMKEEQIRFVILGGRHEIMIDKTARSGEVFVERRIHECNWEIADISQRRPSSGINRLRVGSARLEAW